MSRRLPACADDDRGPRSETAAAPQRAYSKVLALLAPLGGRRQMSAHPGPAHPRGSRRPDDLLVPRTAEALSAFIVPTPGARDGPHEQDSVSSRVDPRPK